MKRLKRKNEKQAQKDEEETERERVGKRTDMGDKKCVAMVHD